MFKKFKYMFVLFNLFRFINNPLVLINLFLGKESLIKLRNGLKFKVDSLHNLIQLKEIFIDEEYRSSVINPKVIIDIGANFGDSSIYYSKLYQNSKIYAFEPGKVIKQLRSNLKINNIQNVTGIEKGIASKSRNIVFYDNEKSGLSSLFDVRKGSRKKIIKVITLQSVFKKFKIGKCDLLKMDCEGAEYEILFSLKPDILNRISSFVVEYHNGITKYSDKDLIRFFKVNKFKYRIKRHRIESNIGIIYASK